MTPECVQDALSNVDAHWGSIMGPQWQQVDSYDATNARSERRVDGNLVADAGDEDEENPQTPSTCPWGALMYIKEGRPCHRGERGSSIWFQKKSQAVVGICWEGFATARQSIAILVVNCYGLDASFIGSLSSIQTCQPKHN